MELTLYHGGNLKYFDYDGVPPKLSRSESGSGLYLTSKVEVAEHYARGRRKLWSVTVDLIEERSIDKVVIELDDAKLFNKHYVKGHTKKIVEGSLFKFANKYKGKIPAYILKNIMINEKALSTPNWHNFRLFMVEHGVDYSYEGGAHYVTLIYNLKTVKNISLLY